MVGSGASNTANKQNSNRRNKSSVITPTAEEDNSPIAYFGSGAAFFKASEGQSGGAEKRLWYQPFVISGSLAVFLLYFCVFREENDIDAKLDGNLFDHVAGLEETQLKLSINYNREHGLPVAALEARLIEVQQRDATNLELN